MAGSDLLEGTIAGGIFAFTGSLAALALGDLRYSHVSCRYRHVSNLTGWAKLPYGFSCYFTIHFHYHRCWHGIEMYKDY